MTPTLSKNTRQGTNTLLKNYKLFLSGDADCLSNFSMVKISKRFIRGYYLTVHSRKFLFTKMRLFTNKELDRVGKFPHIHVSRQRVCFNGEAVLLLEQWSPCLGKLLTNQTVFQDTCLVATTNPEYMMRNLCPVLSQLSALKELP